MCSAADAKSGSTASRWRTTIYARRLTGRWPQVMQKRHAAVGVLVALLADARPHPRGAGPSGRGAGAAEKPGLPDGAAAGSGSGGRPRLLAGGHGVGAALL